MRVSSLPILSRVTSVYFCGFNSRAEAASFPQKRLSTLSTRKSLATEGTFRAYRAFRALFSSNRCPALGDDDREAQHRNLQPLVTCRSDFVKTQGRKPLRIEQKIRPLPQYLLALDTQLLMTFCLVMNQQLRDAFLPSQRDNDNFDQNRAE